MGNIAIRRTWYGVFEEAKDCDATGLLWAVSQ
jgi:hypothetical protein